VLDDGGIGHFFDGGVCGDGAVEGAGSEVAEGFQLVAGKAGSAKGLVGGVKEELRGGRAATVGADATVYGGGSFAVQLLVDDGLEERFKGRGGGVEAHREGANAIDEGGEFGVGGFEMGYGFDGIEREFAAATVVDHGRSLSQRAERGILWFGVLRK